jgi:hypothetical protein
MTALNLANLVIGLGVLVFIVARQLRARPAKTDARLPVILAVIGLFQLAEFMHEGSHGAEIIAVLVGGVVVAAAAAVVRAATVHVWVDGDQAWRQGNWLTALLWVLSGGIHLGYDFLVDGRGNNAGLGAATLLLYFAATCTIQRHILESRAKNVAAAQGLDRDTHITVHWP